MGSANSNKQAVISFIKELKRRNVIRVGAVDLWLSGIRDLWDQHQGDLADLDTTAAEARLCELNVQQQVRSLCGTTVMKEAWSRGQAIDVHGWIYGLEDGLLRVLSEPITSSSLT